MPADPIDTMVQLLRPCGSGSIETTGPEQRVADAASELLQDGFGQDKNPCRLVYGVASLPLGTPVELEVIFEVSG
jgi:enamine deaminase RidA (YjgF/YER057c/UK114 family)